MQTVIPDLYASAPEALSFAPSTHVRAFLLRRGQGNLLIYSAPTVVDEAAAIEELGGVARHYLNHWHEAAFGGADRIAATFEAPLFCHEDDRQEASKSAKVAGDLLPAPHGGRRPRGDPDPRAHPRGNRLSVGQRRASLPVHGRLPLSARGRMGRGGARIRAIATPISRASS